MPLLPALAVLSTAAAPGDKWKPLDSLLQGWAYTDDFVVTVGTVRDGKHEQLFAHEHGQMKLDSRIGTGSTSKWPMAMTMVGVVNSGAISSLDDPVHKYVSWWTSNSSDLRSRVTLKHLLSFTSGFGAMDDIVAESDDKKKAARRAFLQAQHRLHDVDCLSDQGANYNDCAKTIYEVVGGPGGSKLIGVPGKVFSYNSYHLQLAGAVASAATGLNIQEIIDKFLVKPYGMASTGCNGTNPVLAGCVQTTPADYGRFLGSTLGYSVLPKELVVTSEQDYTPFMTDYYTMYGNYAFGHYLLCFDSIAGYTPACKAAGVQIDPGAFGYYPAMDRRLNYYYQVAAYEHTNITYPRSGIPEYLAQLIKPIIDDIVTGSPNVSAAAGHSTPEYRKLALADVNYISQCYFQPETCI
eukprot:TRINITY_DN557_c0_g1_i2.p1 TRINITY_DN557_c0_g1~~TRINITY_DN557_c0_g1_i2.p1  ORF type:complete len:409 (+),score=148.91 TRINITY_DN557_c0_g1_i2:103-1329(+)